MVMAQRGTDTRGRILDTAERIIAEGGIESASLRAVTTAAGVNLAAVNYHFGSKDALVVEVYRRRLRPINAERLRLLDQAQVTQRPPTLESIVHSWAMPAVRLARDAEVGPLAVRLLGRVLSEPADQVCQLIADEMQPVLDRFQAAYAACLPGLDTADLLWRMHFAVGVLAHTLAQGHRLERRSGGLCRIDDVEESTARLVAFIAAGMRG